MATVTGQRRRIPAGRAGLGIVAAIAAVWAVTAIGTHEGSGGMSTRIWPVLPMSLHKVAPRPDQLERAFSDEGLVLRPAGSDLEAARFGPLRSHIVAAYELSGPSAMLVVLFDRPEPHVQQRVGTTDHRTVNDSAGRIYVEYDAAHLGRAAAAKVRRAFGLV